MADDGRIPPDRAVVDRIAEGVVVLLIGPDEREHVVPATALPEGVTAGDWLIVDRGADGAITVLDTDPERTTARRSAARERLSRLREERPSRRLDGR